LLVPLVVSAGFLAVLVAYAVRIARSGRIASPRLDSQRGTIFLGRFPIEAFHWAARAVGVWLARRRASPDALTLLSLILVAFTAPLAAAGFFEAAGAVLLLGSAFDMLDGIVARELGVASEAGEMLDSVLDRYADAFCLMGLAVYYRQSAWQLAIVLIALVGAMMVSYVRAKTEKLALSMPNTVMRRPERIAYLSFGMLLGPTISRWMAAPDASRPVTLAAVALVGAVSNGAAVHLLVRARAKLRRRRSLETTMALIEKSLLDAAPWLRAGRDRAHNDARRHLQRTGKGSVRVARRRSRP
jgi:CDP-diacylglycerol--glycerol-3-phosphate 3-phosphatidyltransferase